MNAETRNEVLDYFAQVFDKTVTAIEASGALSDDSTEIMKAKYAIVLAAEQFAPFATTYKKELANLRHFV